MAWKNYLRDATRATLGILPLLIASLCWISLAQAQTESVIYSFGNGTDGSQPQNSVISDGAGNLYGTTTIGGSLQAGTVFKLSHGVGGWTETVLYTFSGGTDGRQPGGLVFDGGGNLYGTTSNGGSHNLGVIFKLSPTQSGPWKQTVLFSFSPGQGGVPPGSWDPFALTIDPAGNLYGATLYGVKHPQGGTVFRLSPNSTGGWVHSVLYDFSGGVDGEFPALRSLTLDAKGNLYGTSNGGGVYGAGVIFKLAPTPSGPWTQTILHAFSGRADGSAPNGGLIFDKAGNLYGTTLSGGSSKCYPGCGVVFKFSPAAGGAWVEHVLYTFQNNEVPFGGLVLDPDGNLYGTTSGGGISGAGTVFKLTPAATGPWTETVLHSFAPTSTDGAYPHATLLRDSSGNLFGTASLGGSTFGGGVVFEVTP